MTIGGFVKVWNGTSWEFQVAKVWNGSQWVERPVFHYVTNGWRAGWGEDSFSLRWTTSSNTGPFIADRTSSFTANVDIITGGTPATVNSGRIVLYRGSPVNGTYLRSTPLNFAFTSNTPKRFRASFKGIVPTTAPTVADAVLFDIINFSQGRFTLNTDDFPTANCLRLDIFDGTTNENILSDGGASRVLGTLQLYEVEYIDNVSGSGGTVTFYVDGVKFGASKTTTVKPKLVNNVQLWVNASLDNTTNSLDNLEVEYIEMEYEI
jgi:hypothetical protein